MEPRVGKVETTKAPCSACGQETHHAVVGRILRETSYDDNPDSPIDEWGKESHEILQCRGCELISFRHMVEWQFENSGGRDVHYYPPPLARPIPKWRAELPPIFTPVLDEVYDALHAGYNTLALMGARAVLDLFFVNRVGDLGTFERKLSALATQEWVSEEDREYLKAAVDAGSAAAHRAYTPSPRMLARVMDIVENTLQSAYSLDTAKREIRASVPERLPKPKRDDSPK